MKWKRRQLVYAAIAAVIIIVIVLASRPAAVRVETARVERGAMMVTIDSRGETRVRERFVITAPISGRVARIDLREGAAVAAGQLIATITAVPIDPRQRAEAEARVASADATRREAAAAVQSAEAAHELARRERERAEKLGREGVATTQTVDQARTTEERARRELEAARQRVGAAASNLSAVRASLQNPESAGARGLMQVRSPVGGRLLRVPERSERIVRAGEPLVEIGDAHQLELVIDVLSEDAVRIRAGNRVIVEQWGGDAPLQGIVRLVEPAAFRKISALGIEEQRVNVIADLAAAPPELGDAYRIEAKIVVWESPAVMKIPVSALARSGDLWTVFIIEGERAKRQPIEVGHRNPLEAEVLKGLSEGAEVIVHPGYDVKDGARVVVAKE